MTADPRDLLPHFTPFLALELRNRLEKTIRESYDSIVWCQKLQVDSISDFASEIIRRIYRTQLKEAKAVVSFSESLLKYAGVPDLDRYNPKPRRSSLSEPFRTQAPA